MRCPYCGHAEVRGTTWRKNAYTCQKCKRQFRHFTADENAYISIDQIPIMFSRGDNGERKGLTVYLPEAVANAITDELERDGPTIVRSPFMAAATMILLGIAWEDYEEMAAQALKGISKDREATKARLERLIALL